MPCDKISFYRFELRLHLVTQSINMRTIDYQQIINIDDHNFVTFKISLDSSVQFHIK